MISLVQRRRLWKANKQRNEKSSFTPGIELTTAFFCDYSIFAESMNEGYFYSRLCESRSSESPVETHISRGEIFFSI